MTLNELIKYQESFDSEHEGSFKWNEPVSSENIGMLEFLIIALAGEIGEAANIVKKIVRGDFKLDEKKDELEEEIADIFAYLLKISYQMDIDLEGAYINKMKKNREKFIKYEI